MTTINQRLVELIKSPRSHVCRTACQAIGHLFECIKDTRRPVSIYLVKSFVKYILSSKVVSKTLFSWKTKEFTILTVIFASIKRSQILAKKPKEFILNKKLGQNKEWERERASFTQIDCSKSAWSNCQGFLKSKNKFLRCKYKFHNTPWHQNKRNCKIMLYFIILFLICQSKRTLKNVSKNGR